MSWRKSRDVLLAASVLLLMFGLALTSMGKKAPTIDEQGFIVRGLAYLRGYTQIRVGHPLGLNALNASLLVNDETVSLPIDDASWDGTSFHRPAELFMWEIGNHVEHVMFLARLPSIWLGLLMAALAGRWAGKLSRRDWAGLMALFFVAIDPNILANMRLATTDLGLAALSLLAGYTLWRFLRNPSWTRIFLAGAAMGLLQNTKFTALLFAPLFGLVILIWLLDEWHANYRRGQESSMWSAIPWQSLLMIFVAYPLTAILTLWATNGFDFGTLPVDLPAMTWLRGTTLPLVDYVEQFLDIAGRLRIETPSFLLGQYSATGWWYYFPVTFLLKTPLPTLILFAWGAVVSLFCIFRGDDTCPSLLDSAILLVPALGYFAFALTTDINLGYRHLLPLLPLLVIFSVAAVSRRAQPNSARQLLTIIGLSIWLALATFFIYPDFLAYFNLFAGGADGGWRSLVDSNLDWGQDLDDLAPWMAANDVDQVWLSYFGEARPEYYGVNYRGLDSFPPRLMNPQARPYYARDPAPGIYAISATNLQGVHFADHDQFAWFREREALDKLGYSIFLYEVPAYGQPVDLALSGLQMDQIPPSAFARLGTNDVKPRWFDLQQSLVVPYGDQLWLAKPVGQVINPHLLSYLDGRLFDITQEDGVVIAKTADLELPVNEVSRFNSGEGQVDLLQATVEEVRNGGLTLVTIWRQNGPPEPVKLFTHVLDEEEHIISQWDGLGTQWEGWHHGDILLQVQDLTWTQDPSPKPVQLTIGLYDPQTGRRWLTENGADLVEIPINSD